MIEGYIQNLQPTSFYNVRAFYKEASGIYHYGEWITFDPSDFSYFEPTVRTYPVETITTNSATVVGYVLQGTDDIKSQGFQYWATNPQSGPRYDAPANSDMVTVYATGQRMTATFENLDPATTYVYRAFVETDSGYTYGDELTFTTADTSGVIPVFDAEDTVEPEVIGYYDLMGNRFSVPQKGLNIVVYSDGTCKKMLRR